MNLRPVKPSLVLGACLAAVAGVSAFAASAQNAPATADPQVQRDAVAQSDDKNQRIDPYCLQYTGSRIKAQDRKTGKRACSAGPGRVYSRDDLDRTGETDIADALRRLDTSVY